MLLSEKLCWNPRVIAKIKIEIPSSNLNKRLIPTLFVSVVESYLDIVELT